MRKAILLLAASFLSAVALSAAPITFVPPNDTVGLIFSTNSNDGWSDGRGIVFQATGANTISSVGLLENLTAITLNYAIYQTTSASGDVRTGQTPLRSGGGSTTTSGLQFVDFSFAPLALTIGNFYHIEFTFNGSGNQNFFYNNNNATWSQDGYSLLDGTQNGNTSNFVVAAFRIDGGGSSVPEPGTVMLTLSGLGLVAFRARKANRATGK